MIVKIPANGILFPPVSSLSVVLGWPWPSSDSEKFFLDRSLVVVVGNNKPLKWSTIMTELKLSLAGWLAGFCCL